jgi:exodeoxyribonuclease-5
MELTKGQSEAYKYIKGMGKWKGAPNVLVVAGFAGTGKTTLLKMISAETSTPPLVLTPTGKAAVRVQEASGIEATTIHRYIYSHRPDGKGGFVRSKKGMDDLDRSSNNIVFVDEGSMVDQELWEDLFEVCYLTQQDIVIFGDPFQLPPVSVGGEYFSLVDPRFVATKRIELTEIVRQALDNPIIRSSMLVRKGDIFNGLLDIDRVLPEELVEKSVQLYKTGGATICHTNKTRNELNNSIRNALGRSGPLEVGEPLLVIKNNYEVDLFNGEVVTFDGWTDEPYRRSFFDHFNNQKLNVNVGRMKVREPALIDPIVCVEEVMGSLDAKFQGAVAYYCGKANQKQEMLHVNLGYAMTCHKMQGSEAPEVLVVSEPTIKLNSLDGRKWIYTAITRAKERVSLCFPKSVW